MPFWNPPSSLLASGLSPTPAHHPVGTSTGMPEAKQVTGQEHSPTHHYTGCFKMPRANSYPNMALPTRGLRSWPQEPQDSVDRDFGTQLCPSVGRHQPQNPQPCPPTSLLEPWDQPDPPVGGHYSQDNHSPAACRPTHLPARLAPALVLAGPCP